VFELLAYLIGNNERVVGKDELLATVWEGRIVSESAMVTMVTNNASSRPCVAEAFALLLWFKKSKRGIHRSGLLTSRPWPFSHSEVWGWVQLNVASPTALLSKSQAFYAGIRG
jgi:hypothetical protein